MKSFEVIAPSLFVALFLLIWFLIVALEVVPAYQLPEPATVGKTLIEEIATGRLFKDIMASLYRVTMGFLVSAIFAIPLGLLLAQVSVARIALMPLLNFLRFLSPLSWIPFAILWFHIGDKPAIFLIFMSTFFPLLVSTIVAVASVPKIYYRISRDYNYTTFQLLYRVTFPAILPQLISALRMSYGIAWIVIVAAEMVGCQDGLGFGIWDARNGLRLDIVICYMMVIGLVGLLMDKVISLLTKLPNVRWGYER